MKKKSVTSKNTAKSFPQNIEHNYTKISQQLNPRVAVSINKVGAWLKSTPDRVKDMPLKFKAWQVEDKKKKKYRSFKLQKKIKPEYRYIPTVFELLNATFKFLFKNWRVFLTILIVHTAIYVLVIRSPLSGDIQTIQDSVKEVLGDSNSLQQTAATLGTVIGISGSESTNQTATLVSIVTMSLIYIWAIRQISAGKLVKARDAYYQGMAPLIPVILISIFASLQLLPFVVIGYLYTTARNLGIFVTGFEDLAFFVVTVLVALLSMYWVTSTIISLYIVTLPGVYPVRALRSAKKLVQFQRFKVFQRILALPLILGASYMIILLFFIRFASAQVFYIVEFFQILILPVVHTYMYKLYRALI